MAWQPSLSKLRTIILCFPIINFTAAVPTVPGAADNSSKADVQTDAARPYLTQMLEEWKDAGWRLGVGLVLESATGRPLEAQGPWRLGVRLRKVHRGMLRSLPNHAWSHKSLTRQESTIMILDCWSMHLTA
jgi:hypothetical protein